MLITLRKRIQLAHGETIPSTGKITTIKGTGKFSKKEKKSGKNTAR